MTAPAAARPSTHGEVINTFIRFEYRAHAIAKETGVEIVVEKTGDDLFIAWTPDGRVGPYPPAEFDRALTGIDQSARFLAGLA